MKLSIEAFLFDNALMNVCVYALTGAWLGFRMRLLPTMLLSLLGAVYALLSLFMLPALRLWYWKLSCFLLLSMPLYRHAGNALRVLTVLLLSAAMVGGSALMLTLLFGGSITSDGTILGTVPLRAALMSAAVACTLPRVLRDMLHRRNRDALHTTITVRMRTGTRRLKALIDSGNLLRDPLSGRPVLLVNFDPAAPNRPIPYARFGQVGVVYGERARSVTLNEYGNVRVDCIVAKSPEPIDGADAILPESVLPGQWRTEHDCMALAHLVAPAHLASRWQTQYLLVHSQQRNAACAARSAGGSALHRARADKP